MPIEYATTVDPVNSVELVQPSYGTCAIEWALEAAYPYLDAGVVIRHWRREIPEEHTWKVEIVGVRGETYLMGAVFEVEACGVFEAAEKAWKRRGKGMSLCL